MHMVSFIIFLLLVIGYVWHLLAWVTDISEAAQAFLEVGPTTYIVQWLGLRRADSGLKSSLEMIISMTTLLPRIRIS